MQSVTNVIAKTLQQRSKTDLRLFLMYQQESAMTTPTTSAVTPTADKTGQTYMWTLRLEEVPKEVVFTGRVAFSTAGVLGGIVGHKSVRVHGKSFAMVAFWRFMQ